jgi:hypothetical protein
MTTVAHQDGVEQLPEGEGPSNTTGFMRLKVTALLRSSSGSPPSVLSVRTSYGKFHNILIYE